MIELDDLNLDNRSILQGEATPYISDGRKGE